MVECIAREVPHLLDHDEIEWCDGWIHIPYRLIFPIGSTLDWRLS